MRLWIVLMLCAVVASAPSTFESEKSLLNFPINELLEQGDRSEVVNSLLNHLFAYARYVIKNGSYTLGIRPLDPLIIDTFNFYLPAILVNLDLQIKNAFAIGLGDFVVHKSVADLTDLSIDLEVSVPRIFIYAELYDLTGDLYSAIPLYGKGSANFDLENFVIRGKVFFKQSDDGRSIVFDRIENPSFAIPHFKSDLTGVIGGGDIDKIVNAITEDVIIGYVNRFQAAIARATSESIIAFSNPVLNQLDSWKLIAPFLPA